MLLRTFYFLSLLSCSTLIFAESKQKTIIELDEYIITASRSEQKLMESSPSVSLWKKEDLDNYILSNISDFLWLEAGNFIIPNGGIGKSTSLFTRGSESNHTSILLNGRRLPSGFSGQHDLGLLNFVNIGATEYVRGDSSSLYAGALGGVINLRSLTPKINILKKVNEEIEIQYGSNSYENINYGYTFNDSDIIFSSGIEHLVSDGFQYNSDFKRLSHNLYFDYKLNDFLNLDFQLFSYSTKLGVIGNTNFPPNSEERNNTTAWLVSPGINFKNSENSNIRVVASKSLNELEAFYVTRFDNNFTAYTPKDNGYDLYDNRDKIYKENVKNIEAFWEFRGNKINNILGFLLDKRDYIVNPYDGIENQNNQSSVFSFNTNSIFFQTIYENIRGSIFKLGIRHDDYDKFFGYGNVGNFEISHPLDFSNNFRLFFKASFGRVPPDINSLTQFDNFGLLSFDLETLRSQEIGFKKLFDENEIGLVCFFNEIFNLADSSYDQNWNAVYSLVDTEQNGFEAYIKGLSLDNKLNYTFSYSYLDAKIVNGLYFGGFSGTDGQRLIRRPKHKIVASVVWEPSKRYNLGINCIAGLNREDSVGYRFEDLIVVRIFGRYAWNKDSSLFFRVENVSDKIYEYTSGFPAPPRQYYLGIEKKF